MRHLHLLRHAESDRPDPRQSDHARPLTSRGRREAERLADHLRAGSLAPTHVLCSTAVRARETLDLLDLQGGSVLHLEDSLYLATARQLLQRMRGLGDDARSVLVVGHNPGLQELASSLSHGHAHADRIRARFPTAALASFWVDVPWGQVGPGTARLVCYLVADEQGDAG